MHAKLWLGCQAAFLPAAGSALKGLATAVAEDCALLLVLLGAELEAPPSLLRWMQTLRWVGASGIPGSVVPTF
jgi:hypothetical protein